MHAVFECSPVNEAGVTLEGVRGVRPRPMKLDSRCGTTLFWTLKSTYFYEKSTFIWAYEGYKQIEKCISNVCSLHPSWQNPISAPVKKTNLKEWMKERMNGFGVYHLLTQNCCSFTPHRTPIRLGCQLFLRTCLIYSYVSLLSKYLGLTLIQ